jgi:pSer/pThr/pTyr-binding forkhead associated (FHA) protein
MTQQDQSMQQSSQSVQQSNQSMGQSNQSMEQSRATEAGSKGSTPGGTKPHWTSRWRSHYRPGNWLVLSGPTSMVVMQPAAPQWSDLINAVWEDVVDSASLNQIAARMADFRLDQMPDFAALFWDDGTMRSLVRGRVKLVDPESGRTVADGEGVMTWSEVGLDDLQQVQIEAGDQDDDARLELPLVIGAVNASRVLLDCSDAAQISSPQGTFIGDPGRLDRIEGATSESDGAGTGAAADAVGVAADAELPAHAAGAPDEPASAPSEQPSAPAQSAPPAQSGPPEQDGPPGAVGGPEQPTPVTAAAPSPAPPAAEQPPARQVLGVLHPSSGGTVDVDRPVVIGRSPVASRVRSDQLPRLLTVPSPSHDISRTHVQIAPENGRLVVTDLNSTNGTILVLPDGRRADLRPGVGVPLDYGSVIDLGDGITIAVERQ